MKIVKVSESRKSIVVAKGQTTIKLAGPLGFLTLGTTEHNFKAGDELPAELANRLTIDEKQPVYRLVDDGKGGVMEDKNQPLNNLFHCVVS